MKNVLKYQVSCLNTGLKAHIEVYLCTYFEEVFTYKSTPLKKILHFKQLNENCSKISGIYLFTIYL